VDRSRPPGHQVRRSEHAEGMALTVKLDHQEDPMTDRPIGAPWKDACDLCGKHLVYVTKMLPCDPCCDKCDIDPTRSAHSPYLVEIRPHVCRPLPQHGSWIRPRHLKALQEGR
jgi:hypothetical protein